VAFPAPEVVAQIVRRTTRSGVPVSDTVSTQLARYLALLAKWNRTINLTSLPVDPPSDSAVDRLVVEPLVAVAEIRAEDRTVLDIGSGGGSPGFPLKLAVPGCRLILVESKSRKAAFLREVARELDLADVAVEARRVEELPEAFVSADVATVRAVRLDARILRAIRGQLRADGRLLWFRSGGAGESSVPVGLLEIAHHSLGPDPSGRLSVLKFDGIF
jgi:16S rRNA (guanine527-N7)-methyltransferase